MNYDKDIHEKIHCYGWYYINKQLRKRVKDIVIVDYVDNYFYDTDNVIETGWIGFIHHTASNFSDNNIKTIFSNKYFIKSLNYCKFLVSLSNYNKINIDNELYKIGRSDIEVIVLKHPMPPLSTKNCFNINNFNKNKTIYGIGAWLRNPYTIYHSNFIYNNERLKKKRIKGIAMEDYFPGNITQDKLFYNPKSCISSLDNEVSSGSQDNKVFADTSTELINMINNENNIIEKNKYILKLKFHELETKLKKLETKSNELVINKSNDIQTIDEELVDTESKEIVINHNKKLYSRNYMHYNYYNKYLYEYVDTIKIKDYKKILYLLDKHDRSVDVIDYVDNDTYVNILSNNIVFCDYIDCSASNTIVECICTNTPIIVSKLPAIIEYLGMDYPLYSEYIYDPVYDIYCITEYDITRAYNYLTNMNKDDLRLTYFINKIDKCLCSKVKRTHKSINPAHAFIRNSGRV